MKLRHLLIAAAALVVTASHAWAQGNFSDTSMGVRDGPWISNPGGGPGGGEGSRNVNKIICERRALRYLGLRIELLQR